MTEIYTRAKFWKCALQVNTVGYINYRGKSHKMTEGDYNQELVNVALENNIKVIGLASHGSVDGVDAIQKLMSKHEIIVFPGFEIASSEKIHFVCLYPESTTVEELNRYLGDLSLLDPKDGTRPSKLSAEQILQKVDGQGGFIFAAHCTHDQGVLQKRFNHIWTHSLLRAAQIPGPIEDLIEAKDVFYRSVIRNKNKDYKRDTPIALINAKDVAIPQDLGLGNASCLIKMTHPGFEAFKLAFQDPESRVRLNSDVSESYYSQLEQLKITGGYLDGLEIRFSEHLNAVIGGRGTGKSTLIECVRYVLDRRPIGKHAQKQHLEIIKENLGKDKARIELTIRSSKMNGRRFTLARRYGERTSVVDEDGKISNFTSDDLLPKIEVFGQNEIYEIAQDVVSQRQLLERFMEYGQAEDGEPIQGIITRLEENREKLLNAQKSIAEIEDEVARLSKLEEQVGQFRSLGIEEKLKIVPLLETARRIVKRAEDEGPRLYEHVQSIRDNLPDTTFISDTAISDLPKVEVYRKIREALENLRKDTEEILQQWQGTYQSRIARMTEFVNEIKADFRKHDEDLEKTFRELPACEGKTGQQVGVEYQKLMQSIEKIRPKKAMIETHRQLLDSLQLNRKALLRELSAKRSERSTLFSRILKGLNKRLEGKLRLRVEIEGNKQPLVDYLLGCGLEGVGEKRLEWIKNDPSVSAIGLAEWIGQGAKALREAYPEVTPTVAEALMRLTPAQVLKLEEIELPEMIEIELNTAHEGEEKWRGIDKLSTGQQCTAILHLLLLENKDPLLMDQPEDNLDNAFIADRIVAELRRAKISRQFIFATHNANIPVFGDAEWIGVLEASDNQASMSLSSQGAIDVPSVRDQAAAILEGGKAAFNQRRMKYGY
ncbi:MAG: AAA family ATPase [Magnetococcales bacterium]|nr:AAA family ATPase [Magnetococcales bacterium]